jgi:hypothetical protein
MDKPAPPKMKLELEPIDEQAAGEPAPPAEAQAPRIPEPGFALDDPAARAALKPAPRFIEAATREVESGWIERPLWASIMAQCKNDEAVTRDAYIRTRATILQMERRDQERRDAKATPPPREPAPPERTTRQAGDARFRFKEPETTWSDRLRSPRILGAAAAALVAIVVGAWFALRDSAPAEVAAAAPAPAVTAPRPAAAAAVAAAAADPARIDDGLLARIDKTREAGNWNVVVLLATEWTRREPDNPRAWMQLCEGYLKLNQKIDALDAVTRATARAPADPAVWRQRGEINLALNRPEDAIKDFEQVTALDARDAPSLVQLGTLDLRFSRLPQAKAAFAAALAVAPDDVTAACGAAQSARKLGEQKEAAVIEQNLRARAQACLDLSDGQAGGRSDTVARVPKAG